MTLRFLRTLPARTFAVALLTLGAATMAAAAEYPTKPIRLIIPAAAGGSLDVTARLIAQKMSEKLHQQIIIDNRPGADTLLGTRIAKEAPADGYTILGQANSFSLLPHIRVDPGYDPIKDFTGVGVMVTSPYIMAVGGGEPDRSVQDFVTRAKSTKLSYASGGPATPQQVAAVKFLKLAGVNDITMVPYKGAGPGLVDVSGGYVTMIFDGLISSRPYLDGGKLRPLAVTSTTRLAALPNVPTFIESGFDFSFKFWLGLVVRTDTPKEVVQKLSEALKYAQSSKDLNDRFRGDGSDPSFTSPEEFTDMLRKEYVEMGRLATEMKFEKQ